MTDLTPEQEEIRQRARDFARRHIAPRALVLDKGPDSPLRDDLLRAAAAAGVLGASPPEFLGGAGHDPFTGVLATEEFAAACTGCTVLFGATMLGLTPILFCGDPAPLGRFVPPLVESWQNDEPKVAALAARVEGDGRG